MIAAALSDHDREILDFAIDQVRNVRIARAARSIETKFALSLQASWRFVMMAKEVIKQSNNVMDVRADESLRNERVAAQAERLAERAAAQKRFGAASALLNTAIRASAERSRLLGAHAPKQLDVTLHDGGEIPLKLDAILAILDDEGRVALAVIMRQIEAARADGRLVPEVVDVVATEQPRLSDGVADGEN